MKYTLLLRLAGPMQSWGTRSRFASRDTELAPSKSGVIGLLAAALGRPRQDSVVDIATHRMGVRIDREGILQRDYHTAQNIILADASKIENTALSDRAYLADAVFLVGIEGQNQAFLNHLDHASANPHWPLALGRRAFAPSRPIALRPPHDNASITDKPLEESLVSYPPLLKTLQTQVRYLIEDPTGDQEWRDQPTDDYVKRTFALRRVRSVIATKGEPWF